MDSESFFNGSNNKIVIYAAAAFAASALAVFFVLRKKNVTKNRKALGSPKEYIKIKLQNISQISSDTYKFLFSLPSPSQELGLPVGKHVYLRFRTEDSAIPQYVKTKQSHISRAYTPISPTNQIGTVEFVIKVYDKGQMGKYLLSMKQGQELEMRGPSGSLHYLKDASLEIEIAKRGVRSKISHKPKNILMLAGGSGITPMLQILRYVAIEAGNPGVEFRLIFANVEEDDILMREEIEKLSKMLPNFKYHFTLDKPPNDWPFSKGFISHDMIAEYGFSDAQGTFALICGPEKMVQAQKENLKALNFTEDQMYLY